MRTITYRFTLPVEAGQVVDDGRLADLKDMVARCNKTRKVAAKVLSEGSYVMPRFRVRVRGRLGQDNGWSGIYRALRSTGRMTQDVPLCFSSRADVYVDVAA